MRQDPFAELKRRQREMWASFGPTALFTTPVSGHVVRFAGIVAGESVLDVGPAQACWQSARPVLARRSAGST